MIFPLFFLLLVIICYYPLLLMVNCLTRSHTYPKSLLPWVSGWQRLCQEPVSRLGTSYQPSLVCAWAAVCQVFFLLRQMPGPRLDDLHHGSSGKATSSKVIESTSSDSCALNGWIITGRCYHSYNAQLIPPEIMLAWLSQECCLYDFLVSLVKSAHPVTQLLVSFATAWTSYEQPSKAYLVLVCAFKGRFRHSFKSAIQFYSCDQVLHDGDLHHSW